MESLSESVSPSTIPGRGGAALTLIGNTDTTVTILLACGASREQQYDDFWSITIDKSTLQPTGAQQIKIKERDGFTSRNSMTSVFDQARNRVVYFGGQDSEHGVLFNDLYTLDLSTYEMKHIDYMDGQTAPAVRNSHTMTMGEDGTCAYLFGGANQDGPLKDLYRLDLSTLTFK